MAKRSQTSTSKAVKVTADTPTKEPQPHQSGPRQVVAQSPLAKRVGKVKPCSDLAAYNRAVIERNSLIKVLDFLHLHPSMAADVWQALEHGTISSASASSSGENKLLFKEPPKKISLLEADWVAGFILKVSDAGKDLLDTVDGNDPESLTRLFCLATATQPSTPLPAACVHKRLCGLLFMERYERMGKRLAKLSTFIQKDTGVINWMRLAAYTLEWGLDGKLVSVTHIEGVTKTVPAFWVVDKEFLFQDPWLDLGSYLHQKGARFNLSDLFGEGEGPHREVLDKKATLLAENAKALGWCRRLACAGTGNPLIP